MIEAILAIIAAIISYFSAKKAGASDAQAALVGAAAGAGTYYVATKTDWGKGIVSNIENWVGLEDSEGAPILDADGVQVKAPDGAIPVVDEAGNVVRDADGNVVWKLIDESGKVLTNWGPEGVAGVIGTATIASTLKDNPALLVGAAAIVAIILLR